MSKLMRRTTEAMLATCTAGLKGNAKSQQLPNGVLVWNEVERRIYYFDRVEILTRIPKEFLEEFLEIEPLKNECRYFAILYVDSDAKLAGFKSKICCTVPTRIFFVLLSEYDLEEFKVSLIEIARDVPKASEYAANHKNNQLVALMRKRRTAKQKIRDYRDSCESTKLARKEGKFSEQTGYLGSDTFEYVSYARHSKVSGAPCLHTEWSIRGAANIKKRTGIKAIDDFNTFDVEKWFEETTAKYIVIEAIDMARLGKWLQNRGRSRSCSAKEKICIGLAAVSFIRANGISTAAQLAEWLKNEKIRIKAQKGRVSAWDKKILKVQCNSRFSAVITIVVVLAWVQWRYSGVSDPIIIPYIYI